MKAIAAGLGVILLLPVLAIAALTSAITGSGPLAGLAPGGSGDAVTLAIVYARAQLGVPYRWGGETPDAGFDCSGLVLAAYATAGIALPRTAQTQYDAGPLLPPGTPPAPGDLVFFGTPTHVHHVGLVIDGSHMIDAPHTGAVVREEPFAWQDLVGFSRPAAVLRATTSPSAVPLARAVHADARVAPGPDATSGIAAAIGLRNWLAWRPEYDQRAAR
jgi:hypothetical protein